MKAARDRARKCKVVFAAYVMAITPSMVPPARLHRAGGIALVASGKARARVPLSRPGLGGLDSSKVDGVYTLLAGQ